MDADRRRVMAYELGRRRDTEEGARKADARDRGRSRAGAGRAGRHAEVQAVREAGRAEGVVPDTRHAVQPRHADVQVGARDVPGPEAAGKEKRK